MRKVQVIVVAGGMGTRLKSSVPKPLVLLKRKPLIEYCLHVFEKSKAINSIIIVGSQPFLPRFKKICKSFSKVKAIVAGGENRSDSVKAGLQMVDSDTQAVLIHDAARPFIDTSMINQLLIALDSYEAAIVGVPVKATIKQVDKKSGVIVKTLDRSSLIEVQTPQAFRLNILQKAHRKKLTKEITDDAMLVESLGHRVYTVMGSYRNIKITTPEDLNIATAFL